MAKDTFDLRRGEPGQAIDYTDADGNQRRMKADAEGVFRPKTSIENSILDGFDLPVARAAMRDEADEREAAEERSNRKRGAARSKRVVVAETGEEDTRGPGAPAVEPGVRDVED